MKSRLRLTQATQDPASVSPRQPHLGCLPSAHAELQAGMGSCDAFGPGSALAEGPSPRPMQ